MQLFSDLMAAPLSSTLIVMGTIGCFVSLYVCLSRKSKTFRFPKDYIPYLTLIGSLVVIYIGVSQLHDGFNEARFLGVGTLTIVFVLVLKALTKTCLSTNLFGFLVACVGILMAFNLQDYALQLMNDLSITMGSVTISMTLLVKAYVLFSILIWASSRLMDTIASRLHKAEDLSPSKKVLYEKLIRYTLFLVIILIGLNLVGVDMTALTVISGAIAFGIGFGLQKVFSNLISGLILLMDKSIKPGDVIAIDDEYGMVTNLEARYAAIVTRDGKKHLIPNERLVTENVENWSFENDNLRLSIFVGTAYHHDPREIEQILIDCAKSHDRVLKTPEPFCLLKDFGPSSVDYELRFWIRDPNRGIGRLKSDIRYDIYQAFKDKNISIPYPHQEIIVRDNKDALLAELGRDE